MQITNQNSWIWSSVHRCQILECYKNFRKPPNTFENFPRVSEVFRAFPNTSEDFRKFSKILKNCRRIVLRIFRHFPIFSDFFRRLPKTSEDFRRFKNSKMLKCLFKHFGTISEFSEDFRRRPKTSEDFQKFSKISETCWNVGFCTLRCFFPSFPKSFQNIQQRITLTSGNWPTREFFKKFKFNSPCGLVKFWYFLKISLVQINSKLHSK